MVSLSAQRPDALPFGFTKASAAVQARAESRFLCLPSADRIRDARRWLTEKPHMAGTARDRELAEWTRDQFASYGLEDVRIDEHEVLLPWPEEVTVELVAPTAWRASMREDPIDGDPYTQI